MAKRVTKKVNSTELDSKEFFAAIAQIEEEKSSLEASRAELESAKKGLYDGKDHPGPDLRLPPGPRGGG